MKRKATDEQILAAYREHGSVWKAAEALGMGGQTVHRRLAKLGANTPVNVFTAEDAERLKRDYVIYRDAGRVRDLAAEMGRTVPFLSRQAGKLGLADARAPKLKHRVWKGMPESTASVIWTDFKASELGLGAYCIKKGYDDLGFARTMRQYFGDEWEHVMEAKTSKQTMYRLGRQFEYRCRDDLREWGYFVLRSPQSKSPTDLVAIRRGLILFVQCKRGGALGVTGWNELYDLGLSVGAVPLLAEQPAGRGSRRYWRLCDRKDGSRRSQPRTPFDPGDVEEAA